ncbi:hypothetical protein DRQ29_04375, partial [bacterium]
MFDEDEFDNKKWRIKIMKETIIPIGPFHPLLEEPELFTLKVDGETVVDVDVRIGWNHRGI